MVCDEEANNIADSTWSWGGGGSWASRPAGAGGTAGDQVSGLVFDTEGVKKARQEELAHVDHYGVWEVAPSGQCWEAVGKKPLGKRWVDIDRGAGADNDKKNCRSMLLSKEINTY